MPRSAPGEPAVLVVALRLTEGESAEPPLEEVSEALRVRLDALWGRRAACRLALAVLNMLELPTRNLRTLDDANPFYAAARQRLDDHLDASLVRPRLLLRRMREFDELAASTIRRTSTGCARAAVISTSGGGVEGHGLGSKVVASTPSKCTAGCSSCAAASSRTLSSRRRRHRRRRLRPRRLDLQAVAAEIGGKYEEINRRLQESPASSPTSRSRRTTTAALQDLRPPRRRRGARPASSCTSTCRAIGRRPLDQARGGGACRLDE